jgi:hypothetical protein
MADVIKAQNQMQSSSSAGYVTEKSKKHGKPPKKPLEIQERFSEPINPLNSDKNDSH